MSKTTLVSVRSCRYLHGMNTKTELAEHRIIVLVPKSLLTKFKRSAKRNGRSLSGEARFALAAYVEESQ